MVFVTNDTNGSFSNSSDPSRRSVTPAFSFKSLLGDIDVVVTSRFSDERVNRRVTREDQTRWSTVTCCVAFSMHDKTSEFAKSRTPRDGVA